MKLSKKNYSKKEKEAYEIAFKFKENKEYKEAIKEFKNIADKYGETSVALGMIATLEYYEFNNIEEAIFYAKKTIKISPKSEMASIVLAHCLFDLNLKEEMYKEIKRYVATGAEIKLYNTLFEENNLTINDFK
ncbi:MAG: hypothetical protein OEZ22_14900 [Spirochaetia bacterium]|nr:hypothetical protein [Spirochaetia bacterium]